MDLDDWRATRARAGPLLKPNEKPSKILPAESKYVKPEPEKNWKQVWAWLKPRLDKAGRNKCEFVGIVEHVCKGPLDPVHSKKRRKCSELDLYSVAIGCRAVHDLVEGIKVYKPLNRRVRQREMESFVMQAIQRAGGLILP